MTELLTPIAVFAFSAAIIWFFAGLLIEAVGRVAKRFHKTGFSVAFVVLGILTSISEISVAVNATVSHVPEVSAGNLIGASFVLLLLVVPLLAVFGRKIQLNHAISPGNLLVAFAVIFLPPLLVLDGSVTKEEGLLMLLAYMTLVWAIERQHGSKSDLIKLHSDFVSRIEASVGDVLKILLGGGAIFIAGHFLVEQAVFFAEFLSVPSSLIGLLFLSIGTNVPEIVVAIRSIMKRRQDIAFGDYLGSAAANTLIFGILPLASGQFLLEPSEFFATAVLMIGGLALCYFFAVSRRSLSRNEGLVLVVVYVCFVVVQVWNIIRFMKE